MKKLFLLFLVLFFYQFVSADEPNEKAKLKKRDLFDKFTIETFQSIPILSDGRVKPLNTYASFLLLKINGKRVVRDDFGNKTLPTEWLLTALFYPEIASKQKIFLVDNTEILTSFGFKIKEPRARYSFEELAPYIDDIFKRADPIQQMEAKKRSPEDNQILGLAMNLFDFIKLIKTLNFARPMQIDTTLDFPLNRPPRHVIALMSELQKKGFGNELGKETTEDRQKIINEKLDEISKQAIESMQQADWLTIFPPASADKKEWRGPFDLFVNEDKNQIKINASAILNAWEETCIAVASEKETKETFHKLSDTLYQEINHQPVAAIYNGKIKVENLYYQLDLIYNSLLLFGLIFLSICLGFTKPNSKIWVTINKNLLYIPILMLITAICMRCFILERPPVATLYESILFITATICIICMYVEKVFHYKMVAFTTSLIGAMGLFLSYQHETGDATDTMGNLAAVLNSNFWLSTHVTSVTIGYSAGLLAAAFAHIYIISKVFRITEDKEFYKTISQTIYGVLCFCTLFATVGTILGGIWANYSWGRFWGWDPKENGALAIVLWNLIILHGRMGGIFREFGVVIMALFGGMVVVASWWGVNQLGIGLHSYGFTSGITRNLIAFAIIELMIIFIGIAHHYSLDNKTQKTE